MLYLRFNTQADADFVAAEIYKYRQLSKTEVAGDAAEVAVQYDDGADLWHISCPVSFDYSPWSASGLNTITQVQDASWYGGYQAYLVHQKTPKFLAWVNEEIKNKPFHTIDLILEVDHDWYKGAVVFDVRGRPTEIPYYADSSKTNMVFKRVFTFVDDPSDEMVATRTEAVVFINNDESENETKSTKTRTYDATDHFHERINERKLSRAIIIDNLYRETMPSIGLGQDPIVLDPLAIQELGREITRAHGTGFSEYKETGDLQVTEDIKNDSGIAWLDFPLIDITQTPPAPVPNVTLRKCIVNRMKQVEDISTDI